MIKLEKECQTLEVKEGYHLYKYVIVSDAEELISKGLTKEDVKIRTYQELVNHAKTKSQVFIKGNN